MIAVLSDSHIPTRAEKIPGRFLERVDSSEITVHCGDFETREVHERLEERSEEFHAVMGNCERFELQDYDSFEHRGISFGVAHGKGIHPRGDRPTLARIAEQLEVEVLFSGHTHEQEATRHGGKILLNPGSCTGVSGGSYRGGNPEMMAVEVEKTRLEARMLELVDGGIETRTKEFEF